MMRRNLELMSGLFDDREHSRATKSEVDDAGWDRSSVYLTLLVLQAAAALAIIATIYRAFRIIVDDLGVKHPISSAELAMIIAAVLLSQAAYWYRFAKVAIPGWRNVVLGHLLGFASRLSFIFGAAMFSLFFLRHAPDLRIYETGVVVLSRGMIVLVALFCLYCFALELERLGNSLQRNRAAHD